MSGGGSGRRRRRGAFRRENDGRAIVPAAMYRRPSVMDRPEWLPEEWTMELRRRDKHCQSSNRIDRYYICPLSGKRLRSRIEVMRFLNNEMITLPATSSLVVRRTPSLVVRRTSPHARGRTRSLVVAGKRPEWLPEDWSVEFRKRRFSRTVDKYYICPLSGQKLRSRLEVMRFLNIEISDPPARSSSAMVRADISPSTVEGWPDWLPEGWTVEYRPRKFSSYVDKYYISLSSGVKLRSRREVMRFLNNEVPSHLASGSAEYYMNPINGHGFHSKKDVSCSCENKEVRRIAFKEERSHTSDAFTLKEEFLPIIEYKKSKVKRTAVRRRLFGREEPIHDANFEFANTSRKAASPSLGYSSALVDDGASEISSSPLFQIEWYPSSAASPEDRVQRQSSIKMVPFSGNEKTTLVQLEAERMLVPDSNVSEEQHFDMRKKQSQLKWCHIVEELQEWPATKLVEPDRLSLVLMRMEGRRLPIPDADLSKKNQFEMGEKLSMLKRRIKPKRHNNEEKQQGNDKLLESSLQQEGNSLPVPGINMSVKNTPESTKKQTESMRCSMGEEFQGQLENEVIQKIEIENPSELPLELEHKRSIVPDANSSEEQTEMNQKLSQFKRLSQLKRRGTGGKHQGRTEILQNPGNEKLSLPLRQLEDKTVSVPDSNLLEDAQFEPTEKLSQPVSSCGTANENEELPKPLLQQEGGILPVLGVDSSSDQLMQQEGRSLLVTDTSISKEEQFEQTEKQSQPKKRSRGGSRSKNTEAVSSAAKKQPKKRKRKAETVDTTLVQNSRTLVDVTSHSVSILGTANQNEEVLQLLMQEEGEICPALCANLSSDPGSLQLLYANISEEKKQSEPTRKLSQPKRQSRGGPRGSKNTEAIGSTTKKQPSKRKRKAEPVDTMHSEATKPLADATAHSASNIGTGNQNEGLPQLLILQEGGSLPIPDSSPSNEKQFELAEKLTSPKGRSRGGRRVSKNTEAARSATKKQPSARRRKAKTVDTMHVQASNLLADVTANSVLNDENASQNEKMPRMLTQQEGGSLLEPLEAGSLLVPDADLSEEKRTEPTEKPSQPKGRKRGGPRASKSTEVKSATEKKPSNRKRKAQATDVAGNPIPNVGTANRSRKAKAKKIEQAPSAPVNESDVHNDPCITTDELQEKLERLKPFVEQTSQEQQADHSLPAVPKDIHQQDAAMTNELREKLEKLKPFVEQASHGQQAHRTQPTVLVDLDASRQTLQIYLPEAEEIQEKLRGMQPFVEKASKEQPDQALTSLPFGEAWLDPCLEFAFKTLTSDFPVLEDVAAIQDYFSHRLISSETTNMGVGSVGSIVESTPVTFDAPCLGNGKMKIVESIPLAFDGPCLGNGKVKKDCPWNKKNKNL